MSGVGLSLTSMGSGERMVGVASGQDGQAGTGGGGRGVERVLCLLLSLALSGGLRGAAERLGEGGAER